MKTITLKGLKATQNKYFDSTKRPTKYATHSIS